MFPFSDSHVRFGEREQEERVDCRSTDVKLRKMPSQLIETNYLHDI